MKTKEFTYFFFYSFLTHRNNFSANFAWYFFFFPSFCAIFARSHVGKFSKKKAFLSTTFCFRRVHFIFLCYLLSKPCDNAYPKSAVNAVHFIRQLKFGDIFSSSSITFLWCNFFSASLFFYCFARDSNFFDSSFWMTHARATFNHFLITPTFMIDEIAFFFLFSLANHAMWRRTIKILFSVNFSFFTFALKNFLNFC